VAKQTRPPGVPQSSASGEGTGRWRSHEGPGRAAVYEWGVHTTRGWMNVLGPVARRLGVRLLAHD
jgi:hypothetical protein